MKIRRLLKLVTLDFDFKMERSMNRIWMGIVAIALAFVMLVPAPSVAQGQTTYGPKYTDRYFQLPAASSSTRVPVGPGVVDWNTDSAAPEYYDGSSWNAFGGGITGSFAAGDLTVANASGKVIDSLHLGSNGGLALSGGGTPAYNSCYWNDVDSCTTENVRMRERVFIGNAVNLTDSSSTCCGNASIWVNSAPSAPTYLMRDPQLVVSSDRGVGAISGLTRVSDQTSTTRSAIGVSGYAWNNSPSSGTQIRAWAGYFQVDHQPTLTTAQSYGIEDDAFNYGTNQSGDPYGAGNGAFSLWMFSGGSTPANAAIVTTGGGGSTYNTGINLTDGSLTKDGNGNSIAMALGNGAEIAWYTGSATQAGILSSNAAGTIRLGALDAAAPVAQTLQAQSVVTGTSNTAGATFTIKGSGSTGSSAGGNMLIQWTPPGGSGSTPNTYTNAISLNTSLQIINFIGNTATGHTVSNNTITPKVNTLVNNGTGSANAVYSYNATANRPAALYLALSLSNALNTQQAVGSGSQLGIVTAEGSDGTNFQDSSEISMEVDAAVSAGIVPGRMRFLTANASGTLTESFRVTSSQQIQYPGAVTGTPTASLCLDASNNIIKKTTTGSCI